MARWEWTKETQEEFQKMQDKCSEFAIDLDKIRENVTRNAESMQEIDNCISKFEHEVTIMEEKFRRMKYNCL